MSIRKPDRPKPPAPSGAAAPHLEPAELRQQAEARFRARAEADPGTLTPAEARQALHELGVHQIELEMQNEELRRAQEELQASRDRYAELYDFSPVAYFTVGAKGLIQEANLTAAALLGMDRRALVGTPFSTFVAADRADQDTYYRHRKKALGSMDKQGCELRLRGRDGELFHAQLESLAMPEAGGEGDALRIVAIDATDRHRAEAALREARNAAQAADRAKSEFLANMSHEIRTPLSGVLGMTELLVGTPLNPEQRECVEDIRLSGKLLLGIVNDVLELSRFEAVGVALEEVEFALRAAIEDTVHLHAGAAHAKGLELCCRLAPEVPARVAGDPGRLRQVLFNLVGNAIKFTEIGQVVVRAELAQGDGAASVVRVTVEDTGIGIPEPAQHRIFENFSQADPSSSRRYGGTGLGLSICRQLVRAMGGEIGFRSTPGLGSEFWFTVPFPWAQQTQPAPTFGGERALVVEARPTTRALLLEQLARLGVETFAAADRATALQLAARAIAEGRPLRLALVDLELPDGAGRNLVEELETLPGAGELRAILLTSFTTHGLTWEAGTRSGTCHLLKPVREGEVIRCLQTVLAPDDPLPPSGVGREPAPPVPRGTVLLAEDNPVTQKVMVELLKRQGYRAEVVADGAAAAAAALVRPYDLVLMDWQMPGMDGLAATREIRRAEGPNQRVPIVAMTAHALEDHRAACRAAGMDDYLSKPVGPGELARILERWAAGATADPTTPVGLDRLHRRLAEFRASFPPEAVREILETFLDTTPPALTGLRRAASEANARELSERAHALRGTCTVLGTDRVCALLQTLERRGDRGELKEINTILDELTAELERVRAVVRAERADASRDGQGEDSTGA